MKSVQWVAALGLAVVAPVLAHAADYDLLIKNGADL